MKGIKGIKSLGGQITGIFQQKEEKPQFTSSFTPLPVPPHSNPQHHVPAQQQQSSMSGEPGGDLLFSGLSFKPQPATQPQGRGSMDVAPSSGPSAFSFVNSSEPTSDMGADSAPATSYANQHVVPMHAHHAHLDDSITRSSSSSSLNVDDLSSRGHQQDSAAAPVSSFSFIASAQASTPEPQSASIETSPSHVVPQPAVDPETVHKILPTTATKKVVARRAGVRPGYARSESVTAPVAPAPSTPEPRSSTPQMVPPATEQVLPPLPQLPVAPARVEHNEPEEVSTPSPRRSLAEETSHFSFHRHSIQDNDGPNFSGLSFNTRSPPPPPADVIEEPVPSAHVAASPVREPSPVPPVHEAPPTETPYVVVPQETVYSPAMDIQSSPVSHPVPESRSPVHVEEPEEKTVSPSHVPVPVLPPLPVVEQRVVEEEKYEPAVSPPTPQRIEPVVQVQPSPRERTPSPPKPQPVALKPQPSPVVFKPTPPLPPVVVAQPPPPPPPPKPTAQEKWRDLFASYRAESDRIKAAIAKCESDQRNAALMRRRLNTELNKLSVALKNAEQQQNLASDREEYERADEFNGIIANIHVEVQNVHDRLGDLESTMRGYEMQEQDLHRELIASTERFVSAFKELKGDQESSLNEFSSEVHERVVTERDRLSDETERLNRLHKHIMLDLQDLNNRKSRLEDRIGEQTREIRALKAENETKARNLQREIEDLERILQEKRAELARCTRVVEDANTKVAKVKSNFTKELGRLEVEESSIQARLVKCNQEKSDLEQAQRTFQSEVESIQREEENRNRLIGEIASEINQCSAYAFKLKAEEKEALEAKERRVRELELERREANEIDAMRERVRQLDEEMKELAALAISLQSEATAIRQSIAAADTRLPQLNEDKKLAVSARNFKDAARITTEINMLKDTRETDVKRLETTLSSIQQAKDDLEDKKALVQSTSLELAVKERAFDKEKLFKLQKEILRMEHSISKSNTHDEIAAAELEACRVEFAEIRLKHEFVDQEISLLEEMAKSEVRQELGIVEEPEPTPEQPTIAEPEQTTPQEDKASVFSFLQSISGDNLLSGEGEDTFSPEQQEDQQQQQEEVVAEQEEENVKAETREGDVEETSGSGFSFMQNSGENEEEESPMDEETRPIYDAEGEETPQEPEEAEQVPEEPAGPTQEQLIEEATAAVDLLESELQQAKAELTSVELDIDVAVSVEDYDLADQLNAQSEEIKTKLQDIETRVEEARQKLAALQN